MVAAQRNGAGVPQAAALEHREVRRPATDIHQGYAELLLVRRQHGLRRGELAEHGGSYGDAGPVDAGDQVLRGRRAAGNDVDVHLQTGPCHTDRRSDAILLVHDEILRQRVKDFAPVRQRDGLRGVYRAPDVLARDLAVLSRDRDHAPAVERLDVTAGQREMHGIDLHAGGELGLLYGLLDRLDGRLEVDDDTASNAVRVRDSDSDDVDASVLHRLADDGGDL